MIATSNANEQAEQHRVVDELKQELKAPYDMAKSKLGTVEKAINEARVFVDQLNALAAKCSKPLPAQVTQQLRAMDLLIESTPRQLREASQRLRICPSGKWRGKTASRWI